MESHALIIAIVVVCYVTRWSIYRKVIVILNTRESLHQDSG